jgi:DivIVA domain-containing protein
MKWFILFVGIVVICGVVALLLGRLGGGLGRPTATLSHDPLPEDPLTEDDLDELRFDVAPRGYRMGQVDGVLARLRRELREKDEELAVLRADRGTALLAAPVEEGTDQQPADRATTAAERAPEECSVGEPAAGEPGLGEPGLGEPGLGESAKAEPRSDGP